MGAAYQGRAHRGDAGMKSNTSADETAALYHRLIASGQQPNTVIRTMSEELQVGPPALRKRLKRLGVWPPPEAESGRGQPRAPKRHEADGARSRAKFENLPPV